MAGLFAVCFADWSSGGIVVVKVVILESCSPGSVVIKIEENDRFWTEAFQNDPHFINGRISCDNNSKVSSLYLGYLFLVHTHRVLIWAYWFRFTVILGWWPKVSVGVFVVSSSSWKVVVQDLLLLK